MKRNTTIPQSALLTAPFTQGGLIIGITGGTGSGKTVLLDVIKEIGGVVIDCDRVYHELLQTDKQMLAAIETRFPGVIENGQLQRKKLGAIVFSDAKALKDLNAITHKAVKREVLKQLSPAPALVGIDAIGLFEGELHSLCDVTVAVTSPEEIRVKRLMARDDITEEYARARIVAQPSKETFISRCNYHLENDGSLPDFRNKCLAFLRQLGIIIV